MVRAYVIALTLLCLSHALASADPGGRVTCPDGSVVQQVTLCPTGGNKFGTTPTGPAGFPGGGGGGGGDGGLIGAIGGLVHGLTGGLL